ncbi:MAG: hypothetical protein ACT4ON_00980 [Bacteroidota bacterium]
MKKNFLLFLLFCSFQSVAFSQNTGDSATQNNPVVKPVSIKKLKSITLLNDTLTQAPLGKKIKVQLDPLFGDDFNNSYILYVNGIPQRGIKAINKNASKKEMVFKLLRTKDDDDLLNSYYNLKSPYQQVQLSIGNEQGTITDTKTFTIVLYNPWILGAGCFLILLLLVSFFYLNYRLPIIKDQNHLPNNQRPYSLSRTQLAWWSIIILASFIFLICVTGELYTITGSAVILLGISAATTAAGKVIDNKDVNSGNLNRDHPSEGFFMDLLSDNGGVGIHRFQNLAFNIIIGLYFLYEVIVNLHMPEIDSSLLTLMGISSGTYALLKASENKAPATPSPSPATPTGSSFVRKDEDDNAKGKDDDHTDIPAVG